MGFFRKKRNKGSEDFILDFTSMGDTVNSETIPTEQNADGENDLTLPSWEERKKKHAPHAMTVGEILGTFFGKRRCARFHSPERANKGGGIGTYGK